MIQPRPYQTAAISAVQDSWRRNDRVLVSMPTGCHQRGQGILLYDGRIKRVEDIRVGDRLMGPDSTPRTVLQLCRGKSNMVAVVPKKGSPWIVNDEHILTLEMTRQKSAAKSNRRAGGGIRIDVNIKEWLTWSKWGKHIFKLVRTGVQFEPHNLPLPVSPYFLGILLGDGTIAHGKSACVTTADPEIVVAVQDAARDHGLMIREEKAGGKSKSYYLTSHPGGRSDRNALINALRSLKLRHQGKHIPLCYKTASFANRLDLLAGLMDTDGHATCGGYDYITRDKPLADDVAFVARSLGLAAYVKSCRKTCTNNGRTGTYYRVTISGDCQIIPCHIARKRVPVRKQKKDVLRTSFAIEPAGFDSYFGFTLDGDGRYLLDDFTITHNTGKTICGSLLIGQWPNICGEYGRSNRVLWLAQRDELIWQAAEEIYAVTGEEPAVEKGEFRSTKSAELFHRRVVVSSVQTMAHRKERFGRDNFGMAVIDECQHSVAPQHMEVLNYFGRAKLLGITATTDRADEVSLGKVFQDVPYCYGIEDAIRDGYLCPIVSKFVEIKELDFGEIRSLVDIPLEQLDTILAAEGPLHRLVRPVFKESGKRQTIVFCPGVKTAHAVAALLDRYAGQEGSAFAVDGETPEEQRRDIIERYKRGEYQFLVNANLLIEGFNAPATACIAMLRPTKSRMLYSQCLDAATEILTKDGWKGIDDAIDGVDIAAYDIASGDILWEQGTRIERPLGFERMFGIQSPHLDIRVTAGHRMVVRNRTTGWIFKTADSLWNENAIPISGYEDMPEADIADCDLSFLGLMLSDGNRNRANNAITLYQTERHPEVIEFIDATLKSCGFKYGIPQLVTAPSNFGARSPLHRWTISRGQPRGSDKDKTGWGRLQEWVSDDGKSLTPAYNKLSARQFMVLLRAIWMGNGSKHRPSDWTKQTETITIANRVLADQLQSLAVRRGHRCAIADDKGKRSCTLHIGNQQEWSLLASSSDSRPVWGVVPSSSQERVWCVTVPSGAIITRRNGKVAIVGNCVGRGLRGGRNAPVEGKDDCLILDMVGASYQHKLCTSINLLGGSIEECVAKNAWESIPRTTDNEKPEEKPATDLQAAMAAAIDQADDLRRQERQRILAEVRYNLKDTSPFDWLDIQERPMEGWWDAKPPTQEQLAILKTNGIQTKGLEYTQAKQLCDAIAKRLEEGYCTPRQARTLVAFGYSPTTPAGQAVKILAELKKRGFKHTTDEAIRFQQAKIERENREIATTAVAGEAVWGPRGGWLGFVVTLPRGGKKLIKNRDRARELARAMQRRGVRINGGKKPPTFGAQGTPAT